MKGLWLVLLLAIGLASCSMPARLEDVSRQVDLVCTAVAPRSDPAAIQAQSAWTVGRDSHERFAELEAAGWTFTARQDGRLYFQKSVTPEECLD